MRLVKLLTCGVLLAPGYALADPAYTVEVSHSYVPVKGIERLAVMPITCPKTLECEKLTAQVTKGLSHGTKMAVATPQWTSQVMAKAGIDKLDFETGYILAEALSVDAFSVVDIQEAAMDDKEVKHVKISLKIVSKNGDNLLVANGEAQVKGMFTSIDEVAVLTWEAMMQRSMPKN